jgi:uncharacterized protein (DUF1800 family)
MSTSSTLRSSPASAGSLDLLSRLTRRGFLKASVGGAALLGGLGAARSARADEDGDVAGGFFHDAVDPILALVNRVTNGFTLGEYQLAAQMGYTQYLEYQLAHEKIDDSDVEKRLANHKLLAMTSKQIYDWYQDPGNQSLRGMLFTQLEENTIVRRVHSRRQLFERMVEFWHDHFNTDVLDGSTRYLYIGWDRDVIRKHALGTFPDLLRATAKHGNMLYYLDNYTNRVGRPQENYARELLELHTLGVDNGYTQQDVIEVARCLTGWTFWGTGSAQYGDFRFISSYHDQGAKVVLSRNIPANGGQNDGETVLNILLAHPNTARFLAKKLAVHFLGYNPPQSVIDAVATTYLGTSGDIRSMLRTLLRADHVNNHATPKLKRPAHFAASLLRATGGQVVADGQRTNYVGTTMAELGHEPHRWPTPDGYPDSVEAWGQALLPRWAFASRLLDRQLRWAYVDPIRAIGQVPGGLGAGRQADAIGRVLSGGALPEEEMLQLQMFIDRQGATTQTLRDALAVAASLPGFQWY